jgi:hypothetical protein
MSSRIRAYGRYGIHNERRLFRLWFLILEEGRDCSQVGARVNSGEG